MKESLFCQPTISILAGLLVAAISAINTPLNVAAAEMTGDHIATNDGDLIIHPINHATLALAWKNLTIYIDPVGDTAIFVGLPRPDLVLLTHAHQDHFNAVTLKAIITDQTALITPAAVAEKLPEQMRPHATILANGENKSLLGITVEAVPMYNLVPERAKFHPKGQGNGYVLTIADKRVYISGDTEDIPEMRALKNIDVAFLCMNLPYTMSVEQAADAVRAFRPKIVYPYHYRGSDLEKFKQLVGNDASVEIRLRDWYK